MKTPFLGGAGVSRSRNAEDARLVNLYVELIDGKDGKEPGFFQMAPGLILAATVGNGPIRGLRWFGSTLYVISGAGVYSVGSDLTVTLLGTIGTSANPVSTITNGLQVAIFDGVAGYLVPGGYPLTSVAIVAGGSGYQVGDDVNLINLNGSQTATAVATVATVSGTVITSVTITTPGAFPVQPTGWAQASTSGSGAGLIVGTPAFGPFAAVYTLTLPFSLPLSASYQDGLGLVSAGGTNQFYQSNLFDLSLWDPLNFSSADAKPDAIMAIAELAREEWIIKEKNVEIWINAGLTGFAFQRVEGVFPETGCAATFSVARAGTALVFLAQSGQGTPFVARTDGYRITPISPQWLSAEIASYSVISDAIGYAYLQNGHLFYVLTFPTANTTWVYDVTASTMAQQHMWHQRAALSNGLLNRHWSNCAAFRGA